jgi:conjugal transfer pilus assembly protein TraB
MSLKEKFAKLSPENKKKISIALVIAAGMILLTLMYFASGANRKRPTVQTTTTITTKKFTEDSDRSTSIMLGIEKKFDTLYKRIEELEQKKDDTPDAMSAELPYVPPPVMPEQNYRQENSGAYRFPQEPEGEQQRIEPQVTETVISGIDYVSIPAPAKQDAEKKSNNSKLNYVPSNSIFKAVLLTGVYAKTSSQGKSNPTPVIFRLTDLSFFPNEVRRNLSGCYVGGEAHGELSDERVHTRLTSFSCITSDRKSVVDIPVTGRAQGGDGSVGIAGKVISKQEAALLLAAVSGALEGGAEGFSAANSTQNVNVFGTSQQTYTDDQIARNALGKATESGVGVLTDFFKDLLQEISPVIHAQGGQEVELIITKGFSLELEDWQWSGIK